MPRIKMRESFCGTSSRTSFEWTPAEANSVSFRRVGGVVVLCHASYKPKHDKTKHLNQSTASHFHFVTLKWTAANRSCNCNILSIMLRFCVLLFVFTIWNTVEFCFFRTTIGNENCFEKSGSPKIESETNLCKSKGNDV